MTEQDLIEALVRGFPRATEQLNSVHEADAEILRLGDDLWAVTVDDFSAEEDLFFDAGPWLLGWNVVAATLSDLLCVGAVPRFFLPAVCLPTELPADFLPGLNRGTREALDAAGCFLIGGDVGRAHPWRFTGVALGPIPSSRPITRRVPPGPHALWISGALGGANVAAAMGKAPPRFPLRLQVAETIRTYATACIDTSGGFCDAAWNLSQVTPGARIQVEVDALPQASEVSAFTATAGIPPEAALLGGAGEYELLFTLPDPSPEAMGRRLEALGCSRVGRVDVEKIGTEGVAAGRPGILLFRRTDGETVAMSQPPPCPRSAASLEAHVRDVAVMAEALFGGRVG